MKPSFKVPEGHPSNAQLAPAVIRVIVSIITGLVAALAVGLTWGWRYAPLAGWDIAAFVLLIWIFSSLGSHDAQQTADHAVREDAGRAASDLLLILASIGSLVAVGVLFSQANSSDQGIEFSQVVFGLLSILLSWAVIHTVFTLRYAKLYYTMKKGIDFNDDEPPVFTDFAYLAFTLGMTFQVSDTAFTTNAMRRLALRHALLSYVFGTIIIASTINVVLNLTQ